MFPSVASLKSEMSKTTPGSMRQSEQIETEKWRRTGRTYLYPVCNAVRMKEVQHIDNDSYLASLRRPFIIKNVTFWNFELGIVYNT